MSRLLLCVFAERPERATCPDGVARSGEHSMICIDI